MAIENRNIAPGTTLVARHKGTLHTCEVVETENGLRYRLADGQEFRSPSSAGKAIARTAVNGWRFWSLADGEGQPADRKPRKAKEKTGSTTVRQIKKVPNQKSVPEGSVKYHCSACMKAFVVEGDSDPEACPEGHPREAEDELAPSQ